jgi:hypothetical protein
MNFFDILRTLLFAKKAAEDLCSEGLQQFSPFMVNRWVSFYDKSKSIFINETFNKFASLFEDKNEMYKLYFNLIPQSKFKKINYIKKKKESQEEDIRVSVIAKNNMLSKREVLQYIDLIDSQSK